MATEESEIDWDRIRKKLPYERTPEQKEERTKMFNAFDKTGNGILSLAEVTGGVQDVLGLKETVVKAPIDRAFHKAKVINTESTTKGKDDYIDRKEFRMLLYFLRQYFEYHVAFTRVDVSGDHRISKEEFKDALPNITMWVGEIEDPEAEFENIDKNGGGLILFDEFCEWAFDKKLDLEDDDEDE